MNRRGFLLGTGASATLLMTNPSRGMAQSNGSTAPYTAVQASCSMAVSNAVYSTSSGNDWATVSSTLQAAVSDWTQSGYDSQLQSFYSQLTTASISSAVSSLDPNALLKGLQLYQPDFTLNDVQSLISSLSGQSTATYTSIVSSLQSGGFAQLLSQGSQAASQLAFNLGYVPPPKGPRPGGPVQPLSPSQYMTGRSHSQLKSAEYHPGSAHFQLVSCKAWGLAALAVGLAAAVIVIGASGGSAAILVGAAWGSIGTTMGYVALGMSVVGALANC